MPDYETLYYKIFNKITYVIQELQEMQQETEEMFMDSDDTQVIVIPSDEQQIKTKIYPCDYSRK